jgi:hypothetical protein
MTMRRVSTVLMGLAAATVIVGCGSHGDRDRVQLDAGVGQSGVLTRADRLPDGHPPIDSHPRQRVLPEGHPPVLEALPACPGLGRSPRNGQNVFEGATPDVPQLISI